jgi:hypothetical protein
MIRVVIVAVLQRTACMFLRELRTHEKRKSCYVELSEINPGEMCKYQ